LVGPPGYQGHQGEKGLDGAIGAIGPQGEKGLDGIGTQGPQGEKGMDAIGIQGPQGEKGTDGIQGRDGAGGVQGPQGVKGIDGGIGAQGAQGIEGPQGVKGVPGESAYEIALKHGFTGGELDWLQFLRGADGAGGKDGKDGRDAKDGKDGKDGEPGKDALELKILRNIDPTRSYPRGTYAIHDGAFIHASRVTSPVKDGLVSAGWETLIDGESDFDIVQGADFRTFTMVRTMASGRKIEKKFKIPVVLDKGIWKHGTYERGDAVTRDGGQWIAQCETETTPGDSAHWRLAVKRGRDGKDAPSLNGSGNVRR
jgi:hypothetical protein